MIHAKLILEGDGCWPDLVEKKIHHVKGTIEVAALKGGMTSGAPSVGIRIDLSDSEVVVFETSLKIFLTLADGLKAKFGDPRT